MLLGGLLRSLRNGFYAVHALFVIAFSWLYDYTHPNVGLFTAQALWVFVILHVTFINVLTFAAYWYDKYAAMTGQWRVSERALHAMTLIGGTFGAFAGQKTFRHKTRKTRFRRVFWITGWLQIVAVFMFYVLSR